MLRNLTSMSLLLNQPPKLCFRKSVWVRSSPVISDDFSSSSLPKTLPFAIMCADPCRPSLGKVVFRKDGDIKNISIEVMEEMGMIGTSNGWVATLMKQDGILRLEDFFLHPIPTVKSPVELPPLITLPFCQTQMVTNVAMSSSSPDKYDCIVAVKFFGPQLSFCIPGLSKDEWINVRIENPCFFSSSVMFSEKYDMFCIPGSGGHLIASWDLQHFEHNPKILKLRFKDIPKLKKTKRELLDSCCTSEHLVESRTTGETFMVKWYKKTVGNTSKGIDRMETKALMVFKLDEEGNAVYTQDMGDLCIFLTKSESFCVPASSFPTMRPNLVKIFDVDETTIVDLAAQKWN